jgi:hypothetical protein
MTIHWYRLCVKTSRHRTQLTSPNWNVKFRHEPVDITRRRQLVAACSYSPACELNVGNWVVAWLFHHALSRGRRGDENKLLGCSQNSSFPRRRRNLFYIEDRTKISPIAIKLIVTLKRTCLQHHEVFYLQNRRCLLLPSKRGRSFRCLKSSPCSTCWFDNASRFFRSDRCGLGYPYCL